MLTLKKVNAAIQKIEDGWELVKGEGYFYWVHPTDLSYLDLSTVSVYRLNHLTLDQWIDEFVNRAPHQGTFAYYEQQLDDIDYVQLPIEDCAAEIQSHV
jgi:hypothetical protein